MKKEYIAPAIRGIRTGVICDVYKTSTDGIHPEQDQQNLGTLDTYDDNPNTSEIYSNQRGGFGTDAGPWESLW